MPRSIVVLVGALCLSCTSPTPTAQNPEAAQEEIAPWETVSINGAPYRRVAAKPTATQADYSITITIPMSTDDDGTLYLSDTITIGDRVYTADCGSAEGGPTTVGSDDVGNTRDQATRLTVRYSDSAADDPGYWGSTVYQLSRGDVDYFRLRVTRTVGLGILSFSDIDLKGKLMTDRGAVLAENDDGPGNEAGDFDFFVFAEVTPGTYYVEVTGARSSTSGPYSLGIGTWHPISGKPVASEELSRQLVLERLGE